MIHVVDFEKTAFSTAFQRVLAPSGLQIIAESGMGYALPGTRETWLAPNVHLATVLPPHAPRSQTSGFRSCTDPPPLATAGKPTAELRKAEQGPISTSGPSISVCHRTRRFLRTNQFVAPPLAFCSPIDHSLVPRGAERQ